MRPIGAIPHVNVNFSKFKEMYYNVRSLLPKIDELRAVCETSKPDIVYIVETWLDHSISDNELLVPNYQLFRLDKNRHGGGMFTSLSLVLYLIEGWTLSFRISVCQT